MIRSAAASDLKLVVRASYADWLIVECPGLSLYELHSLSIWILQSFPEVTEATLTKNSEIKVEHGDPGSVSQVVSLWVLSFFRFKNGRAAIDFDKALGTYKITMIEQ